MRRVAVTLPFFSTAAVVLGFFSNPTVPPVAEVAPGSSLILIATTEPLGPAFHALESWNDFHGCASEMITLDDSYGDAKQTETRLAELCRQKGATGLLLGGHAELLPVMPESGRILQPSSIPAAGILTRIPISSDSGLWGLTVGRAPVRDLAEAWDFVNACRLSGRTLDELFTVELASGISKDQILEAVAVSAPARPR
jgi:hypothetical protein